MLGASDDGTLPGLTRVSVAEYVRGWLDSALGLSPKTLERYRELAERQIVPHLGTVRLQKLTPEHVQEWHGTLLAGDKPLSPRTVLHAHRVLNLALNRAVKNNTLARNVAGVHKPPAVEEREIEILSGDQIMELLRKLDGHALYPIAALAIATGMRRGELVALRWGDVDLESATLKVERSLEETRAGLRIKSPKTKRGRRNITLPSETVTTLREQPFAGMGQGRGRKEPAPRQFSRLEAYSRIDADRGWR